MDTLLNTQRCQPVSAPPSNPTVDIARERYALYTYDVWNNKQSGKPVTCKKWIE